MASLKAPDAPGHDKPAAHGASRGKVASMAAEPSNAEAFKACMRMVPGAVCIVAVSDGLERTGLTATSWCALSSEPPRLLACVNRDASAHDTILRAGSFSINQLSVAQTEIAAAFAGRDGLRGAARFEVGSWCELATGAPVLAGAAAVFDCEVEETHDGETHTILIGRCAAMHRQTGVAPLIYLNRSFHRAVALESERDWSLVRSD